mgnify:CR=1 FL=1
MMPPEICMVEARTMTEERLTHLKQLEAESIHIIREVAAEFANPVMLYSIGKDSAVMLHLAMKAFYPGKLPFPVIASAPLPSSVLAVLIWIRLFCPVVAVPLTLSEPPLAPMVSVRVPKIPLALAEWVVLRVPPSRVTPDVDAPRF